jgi:hypothetical protein
LVAANGFSPVSSMLPTMLSLLVSITASAPFSAGTRSAVWMSRRCSET